MEKQEDTRSIKEILEQSSEREIVMVVLTKVCSIYEEQEIDVIQFLDTCQKVINAIHYETDIEPNKLFSVVELIVLYLHEVVSENGTLEIYKINEESKK